MTTYLNEEEQLELIKSWWNKYGNIAVWIVLFIGLGFASLNWWQKHNAKVRGQASMLYEQVILSVANNDQGSLTAAAISLQKDYPQTVYAPLSALFTARQAVRKGNNDQAAAQLHWAIEHSQDNSIQHLARLRLARIYLAQGKVKLARTTLESLSSSALEPLVREIEGDIELAKGKPVKARRFYLEAMIGLAKVNIRNPLLQMKINSLPANA